MKYKIEKKNTQKKYSDGVRTNNLHGSGQTIYTLCYEFSLGLGCAYNILDVINACIILKIVSLK